jgi:hypothetical protein
MKKIFTLLFIPFLIFSQIDYNTEIQPILDSKCVSCHQGAAAYYGGLSLTSYDELIEGGYTAGGIISTGLLEDYITTGYMPPYGAGSSLTTEEVDIILQWISEGALEEVESTSIIENIMSEKIIHIVDYMGKSLTPGHNGLYIYIYDNGKIEKKYNLKDNY